MPESMLPFLMFQGEGSAALDFYLAVFPGASVAAVERYGEGEAGAAGTLRMARMTIAGQTILMTDSPVRHDFTFTPALSLFVDCGSEAEVRRLAAALGESGAELMPVGDYGFGRLFAWVADRFGVSWQLNCA